MSEFTFNLQRFGVISNSTSNTLINGTSGNDSIYIYSGRSNITIKTGTGNDTIDNRFCRVVSIESGADDDFIDNRGGDSVTIDAGAGNDTIRNGYYSDYAYDWYDGGSNVSIKAGDGNDYIFNYGSSVSIDAGAGNDSIYNYHSSNVTINAGAGNNFVSVYSGSFITINSGAGKDTIYNRGSDAIINTGAGNDSINLEGGTNITVTGSKGNDTITSKGTNVLFKYTEGDGNDRIEGMSETDTLEITGTYSSAASGDNIIVTVGSGKITLVGAASKSIYIEGKKSSATSTTNTWKLSGTTATYGKIKITGVKSTKGLSIKGKVVTVAASALDKKKVTLTGSGYTLALAKDVTKTSNKKAWSLSGTTATYKQTTTAGYKLASDSKSISYTKKSAKTLATVYGAKSKSGFTVSGKTIKLAASSLSKKVSVSGSYAFEFGTDYKNAKITGSGSSDSITATGQKITVDSGAGNDYIVNKGKVSTINAGAGNDTIVNTGSDVTIRGGKGNDLIKGGAGKDTFVYSEGDGNDTITNYDESDIISIASGAAKVSTSGDNVIFTVGAGKITVQKAAGKTITYFDAGGNQLTYPEQEPETDDVEYSADGKSAKLKDTYIKDTFAPSDYSTYANTLVTIDASDVEQSLTITGNKKANNIVGTGEDDTIYGGAGKDTIDGKDGNDELYGDEGNDYISGGADDDSLWGGKGSDTLVGGSGNDVFYYNSGDGNDTILDYSPSADTVIILSSDVNIGNPVANSSDVTFKIGATGQITFKGCADKTINLVNSGGNILKTYAGK